MIKYINSNSLKGEQPPMKPPKKKGALRIFEVIRMGLKQTVVAIESYNIV